MGQFNDLTDQQAAFLRRIVRVQQQTQCEAFWLHRVLGNRCHLYTVNAPKDTLALDPAPLTDVFYRALQRQGYIEFASEKRFDILLTRRALDYAAHAERSRWGRWWANLRYDLAHDDTVRSKLIWALGSVVVASLGTIVMSLLGWI
jgi:hypothetical protein